MKNFLNENLDYFLKENTVTDKERHLIEKFIGQITGADKAKCCEDLHLSAIAKMMEFTTDSYTLWDENMNLVTLNKVSLGYLPPATSLEQIKGRHFLEFFPKSIQEGHYNEYLKVIETGETFRADNVLVDSFLGQRVINLVAFKSGNYLSIITHDISEQLVSYEKLKESEVRYENLIDNSPIPILVHFDFKVMYINKAAIEQFGFDSKEQALGLEIWSFIHPAFHEKVKERIKDVYSQKGPQPILELPFMRKNGDLFMVEAKATSVDFKGKNASQVIFSDITERKRNEREIIEREQVLLQILGKMPFPVEICTPDGTADFVNDAFLKLFGVADENLIIGKYNFLKDPYVSKRLEISSLIREAYEGKNVHIPELVLPMDAALEEYKITEPESKIVEVFLCPIMKSDGSLWRVVTIWKEITELKSAVSELQNTNAILEAMIEGTDAYIMVADKNGYPVKFNRNYKRIFDNALNIDLQPGVRPSLLKGENELVQLWDLLHSRVLKGERFNYEFSYPLGGEVRYFHVSFHPIVNNNEVTGFSEHSIEITDIKKYENKLKEAKERAEESDRLKSAFLANMSHEIRTPMNAIVGFAELLDDEDLTLEDKKTYIDIITKSSDQLLSLITDIVDISKIEAGQLELFKNSFNLNALVKELKTEFSVLRKNEKNNVPIHAVTELEDEDAVFISDDNRIKQIYINLLNNSLKFTKDGYVEFGYQTTNENLILYVKDTGTGIEKDQQSIIFDRFRQANEGLNKSSGGTGLGLSICKGLAELLGGSISLSSTLGKGSTFYVRLPLEKALKTDEARNEKQTDDIKLTGKSILIVDDNELVREYLSKVLVNTGASLLFASTGHEAIDKAQNNTIDLVLLDIQLPDITGYEVLRLLKESGFSNPIIAQTAFAISGDKENALEAGFDGYLSKPLTKVQLMEAIKMQLRK